MQIKYGISFCEKCKCETDLLIPYNCNHQKLLQYLCRECFRKSEPPKKYDEAGNFICQECVKVLEGKSKGRARDSENGYYTDFCIQCWNRFQMIWSKYRIKSKELKKEKLF